MKDRLYQLKQWLAQTTPLSDRQGHIVYSGVIMFIASGLLATLGANWFVAGLVGSGLSFYFGYLSEVNDASQPGNRFDRKDIRDNATGIAIALVIWVVLGVV